MNTYNLLQADFSFFVFLFIPWHFFEIAPKNDAKYEKDQSATKEDKKLKICLQQIVDIRLLFLFIWFRNLNLGPYPPEFDPPKTAISRIRFSRVSNKCWWTYAKNTLHPNPIFSSP